MNRNIWDRYSAFLSCNCRSSVSKIVICHLDTLECNQFRPVYKRLFKSNRVLRADQRRRVNSQCSRQWELGTTVPNVCLQALTLSLLSPRVFSPFPQQRACSQATTSVSFGLPPSFLEASPLAPNACSRSVTQKRQVQLDPSSAFSNTDLPSGRGILQNAEWL